MIEVLVAALVLAIGLLGLAGLQAASLRYNHSAYLRSQATLLAYGMADRMRANRSQSVSGSGYNNATVSSTPPNCLTGTCAPAQMAQFDLSEWNTDLARELPNGKGVVCIDSTPKDGTGPSSPACDNSGNVYAIKIWWTDERDNTPKEFATAFRP